LASQQEIRVALERALRTITQKPSVGQRVYVNTAVVEDGLACHIEEKHHVLAADLPPSMGGQDSGPSPSTLLRAALSSCVAMGIKMWAARRDVAVDRIEVRVETDVDARGQFGVSEDTAPGFEAVRMHIHVHSPAAPDLLGDIIETSLRFSPLMDVFRQAQAVETQVMLGQRVLEEQ
jgi:uncharacterized OsmC-like protein